MLTRSKFAAIFESDMLWVHMALAAIVILALALRLYGIDFGIPYLRHTDEPYNYNIVISMIERGSYDPQFFNYPSLSHYAYLLVAKIASIFGQYFGYYEDGNGVRRVELLAMGVGKIHNPQVFLAMRLLTVMVGCATVVMVYLCGREAAPSSTDGIWVGLLAALFAATSPTMVTLSQYIGPDPWQVLFVIISVWACLKVLRHGDARYYFMAGIAVGLAAGSKYLGGLVLVALPVAHILRNIGWPSRQLTWRQLSLGPHFPRAWLLSIAVFIITTPYVILDYPAFVLGAAQIAVHYATGHAGMEGDPLAFYLRLAATTEAPAALLAVAGLAYGVVKRRRWAIVVSVFPIIYFILIANVPVRNERTFLPILPFMFLLSADFLVYLAGRTVGFVPSALRRLVLVAACAALVTLPLMKTTSAVSAQTAIKPKDRAREWIAENLPAGSRIIIEPYAPYVDPRRFVLSSAGPLGEETAAKAMEKGVDYLVFSAQMYGRYVFQPSRYPEQAAAYAELFETHDLVKSFGRGGNEVRIYRSRDTVPR